MTDFNYATSKWYQAGAAVPILGSSFNTAEGKEEKKVGKSGGATDLQRMVETARAVGQNLADREVELLKAYSGLNEKGEPIVNHERLPGEDETKYRARVMQEDRSVQAAIQAKTILHQNAQRIFQMFSNLMDSSHQMLMKQIDRIRA